LLPVAASSLANRESSSFSVLVKVLNGDLLSIECISHESIRYVKQKNCEINSSHSAPSRLQLQCDHSKANELTPEFLLSLS
jgi:hypothetical protein